MGKALIVGSSGEVFIDSAEYDAVICADGGYESALTLGLKPDALIGDGDSGALRAHDGVAVISLPKEKDVTDLHACVDYALTAGHMDITITGATGGRLDHFFSACGLLEYIYSRGGSGRLIDRQNEISFINSCVCLRSPHEFEYFSVIPFDSEVTVSIAGAKYPLKSCTLSRAGSLGVSNEAGDTAVVTVESGRALLVQSGRKTGNSPVKQKKPT